MSRLRSVRDAGGGVLGARCGAGHAPAQCIYTHTHTYIYIYIYIERERERDAVQSFELKTL